MDLETENRLASLLMEEARRLRLQADREGVHVYLRQPTVRGRPNSRFLTATVLGVQQANRAVEVNEMWRAREKELELDNRMVGTSKYKVRPRGERHRHNSSKDASSSRHMEGNMEAATLHSSSRNEYRDCSSIENGGLKDDEVEEFLHSRVKRGRGMVGSRMDEPGPYLSHISDQEGQLLLNSEVRLQEEWERRVLGPEKPPSMKPRDAYGVPDTKRVKKDNGYSSKKRHSEQRNSHGKSKKKEKKSKHRRRSC